MGSQLKFVVNNPSLHRIFKSTHLRKFLPEIVRPLHEYNIQIIGRKRLNPVQDSHHLEVLTPLVLRGIISKAPK